jgi:hypothetical protein
LNWATPFVTLFKKYSPSELRLPKLHNWRYHVIPTIKEYGAINGFTTELMNRYIKMPLKNLIELAISVKQLTK